MASLGRLSLTELREHTVATYRKGGSTRPDVLLLNVDGEKAVLKDHAACDRWFAYLLGPLLAQREARALRRLQGIPGVPDLIRTVGRSAILMEQALGTKMVRSDEIDWVHFFERLSGLVATIHAHGIAHCDLRSRNNVLIDEQGAPCIVDFVASIGRGQRWNPVSHWIFCQFCRADRLAVVKQKSHYAPDLVSADEGLMLSRKSPLDRSVRYVGHRIRDLSRRLFTAE